MSNLIFFENAKLHCYIVYYYYGANAHHVSKEYLRMFSNQQQPSRRVFGRMFHGPREKCTVTVSSTSNCATEGNVLDDLTISIELIATGHFRILMSSFRKYIRMF